jgi:hypothetical protein
MPCSAGSPPRRSDDKMGIRLRRLAAITAAAVFLSAAAAAPGAAWTRDEQAVKAAFLYNFARFTEWPAATLGHGAPLSICVVNDSGTLDPLRQIVARRPIDGREVRVLWMPYDGELKSCQVLYVEGNDGRRSADILERLKSSPVLTVGDTESFATTGGMARLYLEGGRIRFAVNMNVAHRAGLYISSKLLALGVSVRDDVDGP